MSINQSQHISKDYNFYQRITSVFCFVFGATAPSGPRSF